MIKRIGRVSLLLLFLLLIAINIGAEEKKGEQKEGGQPKGGSPFAGPANVVVVKVKSGTVVPYYELIGTVYFTEISNTASEVEGKVDSVNFEAGMRVKKGKPLIQLNSDLLRQSIEAAKAAYDENEVTLDKEEKNFKRLENLYKEKSVAQKNYDDQKAVVLGLQKKAVSLKAQLEELNLELQKKVVNAPFDGVVIQKLVAPGEWVSQGKTIAAIAPDTYIDVVVNAPQHILPFIPLGTEVTVKVDSAAIKGNVFAIIPKGDIPTRTFPVKIRIKNTLSLKEGLEARAEVPAGEVIHSLLVPRDAVIPVFGQNAVFAVVQSKAVMLPVKITGYQGMMEGVEGEGLQEGMDIVIKGNERLRPGQDVAIFRQ